MYDVQSDSLGYFQEQVAGLMLKRLAREKEKDGNFADFKCSMPNSRHNTAVNISTA